MTADDLGFEQGPNRPPNEAHSLLLRLTRNCPWNQCQFCPVYKKRKFSLRSLRVPPRVPLYEKLADGRFTPQSDDGIAEEIGRFIEPLDGITGTVTSDHIMNLLEEVSGGLPDDKQKMLTVIRRYQTLPDEDRLVYRIGRRGGAYRSLDDLRRDPATCRNISGLIEEMPSRTGDGGVDQLITEMVDRYI
jgi:hypothetical protein